MYFFISYFYYKDWYDWGFQKPTFHEYQHIWAQNNWVEFTGKCDNWKNDIFSYLYGKNENNYRSICAKFINTNEDGIQQIDVSVVNAFVIAVPWMINYNFTNMVIDRQKFYEIRKESYQLFAKLLRHSVLELRDIILNSIINNIRYFINAFLI